MSICCCWVSFDKLHCFNKYFLFDTAGEFPNKNLLHFNNEISVVSLIDIKCKGPCKKSTKIILRAPMSSMQCKTSNLNRFHFSILIMLVFMCSCGAHYTHFKLNSSKVQSDEGLVIDSLSDIVSLSYAKSTYFEFKVELKNSGDDTLHVNAENYLKLFQESNNYKLVKSFDLDSREPVVDSILLFNPHQQRSFTFGFKSARHFRDVEDWRQYIDSNPIFLKLPNYLTQILETNGEFLRIPQEQAIGKK